MLLQDEEVASAIICKPINAQAFNVSAVTQGLNSTASVCERLHLNEEEELAVRPVVPRNIADAGCRTQIHNITRTQKRPDPFSLGAFPHLLQIFCTNQADRHSH